jgi:cobalt-zinc-cadmium efflux system protein
MLASSTSPQDRHVATPSAAGQNQRRLAIVLGLTAAYMLAEVVGGLLTNSLALLADAGHMLTDVLGLGMALAAIKFSQRPATPTKTYGFYRTEVLAALVNCMILFGVAGFILVEAWRRFQEPTEIRSSLMLLVGIGGLIVNLIGARLLHEGSSASLNVRGAFLEVLSDLLGSVGVIVAALIIGLTGWWQVDPLISVLIALFILPRTWHLLKSVLDVLLEAAPSEMRVEEIRAAIGAVPGVVSVHDLHLWTITSGFVAMSGHVEAADRSSSEVLHDVQRLLRDRFGIEHATLQVESSEHADDGACCSADPRCLVVGENPWRTPLRSSR